MYNFILHYLSGWRIPPFKERVAPASPRRVGYYLWHFPTLSETFIQREVLALKRAELAVLVFADAAEDVELLGQEGKALVNETNYLLPMDARRLRRYHRNFFFNHPRRYLELLIYTIGQRHSGQKDLKSDFGVFNRAVYLAGWAQEQNIHFFHSPWANLSAFIVLIASRLAGIPYSVQARASADLYRLRSRYALNEKFEHAQFILTNARFNRPFIEMYLNAQANVPIYVVYEGLDPARFPMRQPDRPSSDPIRIVSVARLIEEKGLVYLLEALKLLSERGISFHCEIVGGRDESAPHHYDELQALRTKLELQGCVAFPGALAFDGVMEKYAGADIFVLPCVPADSGGRDVTPNALMEAMAMGLPVISTNMSGIPEIVEHRVSGLLIPPKNARALALALEELIADRALRTTLGRNARKRVEERFDINKNMPEVVELFRTFPQ